MKKKNVKAKQITWPFDNKPRPVEYAVLLTLMQKFRPTNPPIKVKELKKQLRRKGHAKSSREADDIICKLIDHGVFEYVGSDIPFRVRLTTWGASLRRKANALKKEGAKV